MESERCAQQRAQESLLAVLCKSLKEEHRAELQTSQRQMAQVQEETGESNHLQANRETWWRRICDMVCVWSVATGASEGSAAPRAGCSGGREGG